MNEKIIEIENLSKQYKDIKAVDKLNLNVYRGDVFGFLGPNGAGKSTTIRMLLTLISPTEGNIKIFNKPLNDNRLDILSRIGAIVEKPDFYKYLTAYKNLELLAKLSGIEVTKNKIMEILELVGLKQRYNSKVKTFSHGMNQRLGLAQALIHDPELIILDEPTTGLDPQGMKEIRELIIYLSKEKKKTIFLSSHILHEVEMIANRMIIINKGTTVIEGYVDELLSSKDLRVTFEVSDEIKTSKIISENTWGSKLSSAANNRFIFTLKKEEIPHLNKFFIENGIDVSSVVPSRSLEEYFLSLTEKEK